MQLHLGKKSVVACVTQILVLCETCNKTGREGQKVFAHLEEKHCQICHKAMFPEIQKAFVLP